MEGIWQEHGGNMSGICREYGGTIERGSTEHIIWIKQTRRHGKTDRQTQIQEHPILTMSLLQRPCVHPFALRHSWARCVVCGWAQEASLIIIAPTSRYIPSKKAADLTAFRIPNRLPKRDDCPLEGELLWKPSRKLRAFSKAEVLNAFKIWTAALPSRKLHAL